MKHFGWALGLKRIEREVGGSCTHFNIRSLGRI